MKNEISTRIFYFIFICATIYIVNCIYNFTPQNNIDDKVSEIKGYVQPISSIDINNSDFADIDFLSTVLENKRIVFLGEPIHSDGSAFEAKSRLIRYLHEEMDFDVVLYEAGLYDMWHMNNYAQSTDVLKFDPSVGLYPFWWDNNACEDLWSYYDMSLKSKQQITLGGFDIQLTGNKNIEERLHALEKHLYEKQINLKEYKALNEIRNKLTNFYLWEYNRLRKSQYDSIQIDLGLIVDKLNAQIEDIEDEVYSRYLSGIKQYNKLMWDYNPGDIPRMNVRDSLMANNLMWLVDSVYQDKKIIVWLANLHLFNNVDSLNMKEFIPMGKLIKEKYKESSYMMAFTSYAQKNEKSNGFYNEASNKSLEYVLHRGRFKYGYIDMRDVNTDSYLKGNYTSTMNQKINMNADWSQMIDGLFYIDIMGSVTNYRK